MSPRSLTLSSQWTQATGIAPAERRFSMSAVKPHAARAHAVMPSTAGEPAIPCPLQDDAWKVVMAKAVAEKFGRSASRVFADAGARDWGSKELMRITEEMCLADLRRDRLPRHNPYVGSFHRGIAVSNASHPTWDLQVERMFATNPYVGRVTRGEPSLSFKKEWVATKSTSALGTAALAALGSKTPPRATARGTRPPRSPHATSISSAVTASAAWSNVLSDPCARRGPDGVLRVNAEEQLPTRRKKNRSESFEDIMDHAKSQSGDSVPQTAALCGLQGMLPRQSGMRVLQEVGQGSFAKVVLAINKKNSVGAWADRRVKRKLFDHFSVREGQRIVMKCIEKGRSLEEDMAIVREVTIHGRLLHPNIAACHGFYEDQRHMVMILDFVEGSELKDVLFTRRRLDEAEACHLMLQAARALAYLHAQRVVHRDISPRNLLVTNCARLYLIDFGLAVDLDEDMSHVQPGAGTMGYLAPELLQDCTVGAAHLKSVGPALDVWGLGCIVYEAVCGFAPFLPQDLYKPGGVDLMFPDETYGPVPSSEVQDLCKALLTFAPQQRLTADSSLSHQWFKPVVAPVDALIRMQDSGSAETIPSGKANRGMGADEAEPAAVHEAGGVRGQGGLWEKGLLRCENPSCGYAVAGEAADWNGGGRYCCHPCMCGKGHGPRCARVAAEEVACVLADNDASALAGVFAAYPSAVAHAPHSDAITGHERDGSGGAAGVEHRSNNLHKSLSSDFAELLETTAEVSVDREQPQELRVQHTFRGLKPSHQNVVARVTGRITRSLSPQKVGDRRLLYGERGASSLLGFGPLWRRPEDSSDLFAFPRLP